MNNIELYKVFNFKVDTTFGDIPKEILYDIFKDGRAASHLLARQLEVWFPSLTFVDATFYDYIDTDKKLYECKCFTEKGAKVTPSSMQGSRRKLNFEKFVNVALNTIYVLPDIRRFPEIKVIFIEGKYVLENFKKGSLKNNKGREMFQGMFNLP